MTAVWIRDVFWEPACLPPYMAYHHRTVQFLCFDPGTRGDGSLRRDEGVAGDHGGEGNAGHRRVQRALPDVSLALRGQQGELVLGRVSGGGLAACRREAMHTMTACWTGFLLPVMNSPPRACSSCSVARRAPAAGETLALARMRPLGIAAFSC